MRHKDNLHEYTRMHTNMIDYIKIGNILNTMLILPKHTKFVMTDELPNHCLLWTLYN